MSISATQKLCMQLQPATKGFSNCHMYMQMRPHKQAGSTPIMIATGFRLAYTL
jgi:hypothetical protein